MASPLQPIEDGVYALLAAATALTTALGGTAIYIRDVPVNTAPPYVVIDTIRGEDRNICPHRLRVALLSVQAISTSGAAQAGTLDGYCDTALHDSNPSVTGWTALYCWRQRDIVYSQKAPDGREYFHAGGQYEIQVTQT